MKRFILLSLLLLAAAGLSAQEPADVAALRAHIGQVMPQSVRVHPEEDETLIGLPYPYSVPAIRGAMQEMYYWDTYYTNLGLLSLGDIEQAKNNAADILYLIGKMGYMPNGSHKSLLSRSQPPYACLIVRDIYEKTGDKEWLAACLPALEKEYEFWMTERIAPNGLNSYGHQPLTDEEIDGFFQAIASRLGADTAIPADARISQGRHWLAEAESGWDFDPRFDRRCLDFNPLDLNANLYIYETTMARFCKELGRDGTRQWKQRARTRRRLIRKYCLNRADGLFYDYDYVNGRHSEVLSGAIFNLMNAGLLTRRQARKVCKALPRLELEFGIAACEKGGPERPFTYQWDYPNAWGAVNCMAVKGLDRYGFREDARRIARKYVESNVRQFKGTGMLFEKYNALTGWQDAASEYGTPGNFMGWTAGTFLFCADYLYRQHP